MAKIKIRDLPKDMKVSEGEMKKIFGGKNWMPRIRYFPPDPLPFGLHRVSLSEHVAEEAEGVAWPWVLT